MSCHGTTFKAEIDGDFIRTTKENSMLSSVTISLVPEARGGPFVFWDDVVAGCTEAKKFGFDAVEIFAPGPEELKKTNALKIVQDHGLKLAALGTGGAWVRHQWTNFT
jgi:hypothetical protein